MTFEKYREKLFVSGLQEKMNESLKAVLPIIAIVFLLSITVAPMSTDVLLAFIFGSILLVFGMMLFNIGAEIAMGPMGQKLGSEITKTKKIAFVLVSCFLLGFMITMSEPDLQVLADQVQSIPRSILIMCVSAGVGLFLVLSILRMLFGIPLRTLLIISYVLVFGVTLFAPRSFIAVAFDSGGVTTGPMTVPFIMSFGIGISAIRSDRHAAEDSFGLIALCSVGPILSVLLLSLIYKPESAAYSLTLLPEIAGSVELGYLFSSAIPTYIKEIAFSLLPIMIFFMMFQIIKLRLDRKVLIRIIIGIVYTYIGLVLFLTGVNVGFMPAGSSLGLTLGSGKLKWCVIPIGMLIGYFIVQAEPAVYVLMKQVEELTNGEIKGKALRIALSVAVALSVGLAMLRVLTGISIYWIIIPGYALALLLTFFVPRIFVAIAFDSGGVASGPMTATFLLPFSVGACYAVGGNIETDAFGVVAMVAMIPLITIQLLGIVYRIKTSGAKSETGIKLEDEFEIIEL